MTRLARAQARSMVAALAVLLLAAGCARPASSPPATPDTRPPTTSEPTSQPAPGPVALSDLRLELVPVARGLEQPLALANAGDGSGRLFVAEQAGRVRVLRAGAISEGAFLDVSRRISAGGERGLLGLAFAPDYAQNGNFYVNYTDTNGDTVVARFTADDPASDTPRLAGPETLLSVAQPFANHNGGCIVFEPGTTRLWVGMGDGGSGGDPRGNAQNPRALLGKMLVLDVGDGSSKPKPQIVQSGVRNPWRFSFDRLTNDLWIADVGQNAWEEVDFVDLDSAEGVNWGWNKWEGTHPYPAGASPSKSGFRFPIAEYGHDKGSSITGGFVYRGTEYPAMQGAYFYGDYGSGWIAGIRRTSPDGTVLDTPEERDLIEGGSVVPSSFGEDEDGELYLCDYTGTVWSVTGSAR